MLLSFRTVVLSLSMIVPAVAAPKADPAAVKQVTEVRDRLVQDLKTLPRDRFDAPAILEITGRDPDAIAKWVQGNTVNLEYRGMLRGPAGVLMDRAGNSLDRSLLLAELLQAAGYETRLANVTLEKAEVFPATPPSVGDPSPEQKAAMERVRKQAESLLAILGPTESKQRSIARQADYWWVQRKRGAAWVDVDRTGKSGLTPTRTVTSIDPADRHQVTVRVVIEAFRDGQLKSEPVLSQTFTPSDVLGRTIVFANTVFGAVGNVDLARGGPKVIDQLKKQEVFLPILRIDDRVICDAAITTSGEVDHDAKLDPAGKLAKSTGAKMGGMGGMLAGGGDAAAKPGALTAEFIDYDIQVPGEKLVTVRRPVFDLIGPAARAAGVKTLPSFSDEQQVRRALMLLGQTRILIQGHDLTPDFLVRRTAQRCIKDTPVLLSLLNGEADTPAKFEKLVGRFSLVDEVTHAVAVIRAGISPQPSYIDRPNILQNRIWFVAEKDGRIDVVQGVDLAYTSGDLAQGVADTLAEMLVFGDAASPADSAFGILEKAPGKLVTSETELAALNLPPGTAARARADLQAGNRLVVATADGRTAWWRIDPAGHTVGVMDSGYNAGVTEKAELAEKDAAQITGQNMSASNLKNLPPDKIKALGGNHFNAVDLGQCVQDCQVWDGVWKARMAGGF